MKRYLYFKEPDPIGHFYTNIPFSKRGHIDTKYEHEGHTQNKVVLTVCMSDLINLI